MTQAERVLVALYERTTPSVRRRGRSWYPEALRLCQAMADTHGYSLSQVVAVLAITSADAQLVSNLRWTEEILRGERVGGRYPNMQGPKVRAVLASPRPGRFVTGEKCRPFYEAIMGNTDALVVDRWAALALGHRGKYMSRPFRRELDNAYRSAAAACGETVRAFQAMVWIAVRETMPKRGHVVVVPRLVDITT